MYLNLGRIHKIHSAIQSLIKFQLPFQQSLDLSGSYLYFIYRFMTDSVDLGSSSRKSPEFGSPAASRDIKFTTSQLKTNYKEDAERTPYKGVFGRSEFRFRDDTADKKEPKETHEKRSTSTYKKEGDKKEVEDDPELDKIEDEIKEIGERLRNIHLESIGKEPGKLEEQRRELKKRLIDLDYDHKMICAKKKLYGKDGPSALDSPSTATRLAKIETQLALSRARRLRELQRDLLLCDYYMDWPYYSYSSVYRPWRLWDRYPSYPYYTSLWWL